MNEADKTEYDMKRLDHFKTRFQEHQRSLIVSKKEVIKLKEQYEACVNANPTYQPNQFEFLVNIAKLVVAARRAVSYTYAMRYYMKGKNKQIHFDFIQASLEGDLEKLNGKIEEDWLGTLDHDMDGKPHLGDRFFAYKQQVTNLNEVLERHFNNMMKEIMLDFPSAPKDNDEDDTDYTFDTA